MIYPPYLYKILGFLFFVGIIIPIRIYEYFKGEKIEVYHDLAIKAD